MSLIFGTGFYGKIAEVENQYIETKFFHVWFIPLIPTSSIFVTSGTFRSRQGVELPLNSTSIIATYARLFTSAAALFFLANAFFFNYSESGVWDGLAGLAFSCAALYLFFFFGKADKEEITLRRKIGSVTGLYTMPQWLDFGQANDYLQRFNDIYQQQYPGSNWKQDIEKGIGTKEKLPVLFALALFNCMVFDLPENEQLYYTAEAAYVIND